MERMTKKDLASKLAQGVRRAMQPQTPAPEAAAPTTAANPEPASTSAARPVRQAELSPNRGRPGDDLHPERIWPD
jgi:hypothetical protein